MKPEQIVKKKPKTKPPQSCSTSVRQRDITLMDTSKHIYGIQNHEQVKWVRYLHGLEHITV